MDRNTPQPRDEKPPRSVIGPPMLNSKELFTHGREVLVRHGEAIYRLCLTSSNKLILVK